MCINQDLIIELLFENLLAFWSRITYRYCSCYLHSTCCSRYFQPAVALYSIWHFVWVWPVAIVRPMSSYPLNLGLDSSRLVVVEVVAVLNRYLERSEPAVLAAVAQTHLLQNLLNGVLFFIIKNRIKGNLREICWQTFKRGQTKYHFQQKVLSDALDKYSQIEKQTKQKIGNEKILEIMNKSVKLTSGKWWRRWCHGSSGLWLTILWCGRIVISIAIVNTIVCRAICLAINICVKSIQNVNYVNKIISLLL